MLLKLPAHPINTHFPMYLSLFQTLHDSVCFLLLNRIPRPQTCIQFLFVYLTYFPTPALVQLVPITNENLHLLSIHSLAHRLQPCFPTVPYPSIFVTLSFSTHLYTAQIRPYMRFNILE